MILTKRSLLRLLFGVEIGLFFYIYLFSPHGLQKLFVLKKEMNSLVLKQSLLKDEVKDLHEKVALFTDDSFYKEKIAREQLYMARKNEEVYFVK